jgi:hypothetical protein
MGAGFKMEASAGRPAAGVSADAPAEEAPETGMLTEAALDPGPAEAGAAEVTAPEAAAFDPEVLEAGALELGAPEEAGAWTAMVSWDIDAELWAPTTAKLDLVDREAAQSRTRSGRGGFMGFKSPSSNPTGHRPKDRRKDI